MNILGNLYFLFQKLNLRQKQHIFTLNFFFFNFQGYSPNTILNQLEFTESEYYEALSIYSDNDFQIHFRRPPNSCFINNYFDEGLLAWNANLDMQPVINHCKTVTYCTCARISPNLRTKHQKP